MFNGSGVETGSSMGWGDDGFGLFGGKDEKMEEIKVLLDNKSSKDKLEGLKRLIAVRPILAQHTLTHTLAHTHTQHTYTRHTHNIHTTNTAHIYTHGGRKEFCLVTFA